MPRQHRLRPPSSPRKPHLLQTQGPVRKGPSAPRRRSSSRKQQARREAVESHSGGPQATREFGAASEEEKVRFCVRLSGAATAAGGMLRQKQESETAAGAFKGAGCEGRSTRSVWGGVHTCACITRGGAMLVLGVLTLGGEEGVFCVPQRHTAARLLRELAHKTADKRGDKCLQGGVNSCRPCHGNPPSRMHSRGWRLAAGKTGTTPAPHACMYACMRTYAATRRRKQFAPPTQVRITKKAKGAALRSTQPRRPARRGPSDIVAVAHHTTAACPT